MLTSDQNSRTEQYFILAAFILAVLLRFFQLGVRPLSDAEARLALQAWDIARGGHPVLDAHPGYILLTAINFFLFGSGNFLARFWPALAGASLVFLPVAFSKQLGRMGTILLVFALAVDPGLIAISRIADDRMMALGFLALFFSFLHIRSYKLAGVMAGVALLSGPSIWLGLLGILITLGLIKISNKNWSFKELGISDYSADSTNIMLYWGLGTFFILGTLLFVIPNGLSAWAGSLIQYFQGFFLPVASLGWHPWITLLVYEALLLVLGIIGLVVSFVRKDHSAIYLAILSFVILFLASIDPSHQIGDLVWFILPFWVMAIIGLARILDGLYVFIRSSVQTWVVAVVSLIFLVFIELNLKALPNVLGFNNDLFQSRLLLIIGALVLLVLVVLLASSVWDERIAQAGVLLGVGAALLLITISAGIAGAGIKMEEYNETWSISPQFTDADMLLETIQNISQWQVGQPEILTVTVSSDVDYPSLLWTLRNFQLQKVSSIPKDTLPELIVHAQGDVLPNPDQYRERAFEIGRYPVFSALGWDGWFRWSMTRSVPYNSDHLVLAVRTDILPVSIVGSGQ